jgi:hypothetical protein
MIINSKERENTANSTLAMRRKKHKEYKYASPVKIPNNTYYSCI